MLIKPWRYALRLIVMLLALVPVATGYALAEYRVLWVDVFHSGLRSRAEADVMLKTARDAGYNAICIQVRKAADAYYDSQVEPKNRAVEAGFDPLAYIIAQAHGQQPRLEVYAWLVTYRVRIGSDPTYKDPNHIYQKHTDWLSETRSGNKTAASNIQFFDPGVPGVIDHNLIVVRDILSRYEVDGIVFDYIRYPESEGGPSQWGYNPIAIRRFNELYGRTGKPDANDPQFAEFRRRQIYDHMRKIYAHVRAWRPRVKIGAATITWGPFGGDFRKTSSYTHIFQDWETMVMDGWLDMNLPMNYKREHNAAQAKAHRDWASFLAQVSQRGNRHGINIVDGEELNSLAGILAQVRDTRTLPGMAGISTYAYSQPRAGSKNIPDAEFFRSIKKELFSTPATIPTAPWLTQQAQHGWVKGVVSRGGKPVDGATVWLGTRSTHTDGTGFYAFANVPPGNYEMAAEDKQGVIGKTATTIQAGRVAEAPISSGGSAPAN